MTYILKEKSTDLVLTVENAKMMARSDLDTDYENMLFRSLIRAAQSRCEQYIGYNLLPNLYEQIVEAGGVYPLLDHTLSVNVIGYDQAGDPVDDLTFIVNQSNQSVEIVFGPETQTAVIELQTGFATEPNLVDPALVQGISLLVESLYQNRSDGVNLPANVRFLWHAFVEYDYL